MSSTSIKLLLAFFAISFSLSAQINTNLQSVDEMKADLIEVNEQIRNDSLNASLYIKRSNLNIELGEFEQALSDCYKAKALGGSASEIHIIRARLSGTSKNFGIAERFLEKAELIAENNNELHAIYLRKAEIKNAQSLTQEAINLTKESLIYDSSKIALFQLANYYRASEKFEQSDEIYAKLFKLDSLNYTLHLEYAKMCIQRELYELALEHALKAASIDSRKAEPHNYLGTIYYHLGNFPKSLNHVNQALVLDPNNYNSFMNRAHIYLKLNEVDNACDDMFRSMQNGYLQSSITMDLLSLYVQVCEL
jgi:tetratricopeptide (TPR) repeat protein